MRANTIDTDLLVPNWISGGKKFSMEEWVKETKVKTSICDVFLDWREFLEQIVDEKFRSLR